MGREIVAETPLGSATPDGLAAPYGDALDSTVAAPPPAPSPSSGGEGGDRPTPTRAQVATAVAPAPTPAVAAPTSMPSANSTGNGRLASGSSANGAGAVVASLGAGQKVAFSVSADSPSCMDCGSIMVRNGSCYKCLNCGSTSGCS